MKSRKHWETTGHVGPFRCFFALVPPQSLKGMAASSFFLLYSPLCFIRCRHHTSAGNDHHPPNDVRWQLLNALGVWQFVPKCSGQTRGVFAVTSKKSVKERRKLRFPNVKMNEHSGGGGGGGGDIEKHCSFSHRL